MTMKVPLIVLLGMTTALCLQVPARARPARVQEAVESARITLELQDSDVRDAQNRSRSNDERDSAGAIGLGKDADVAVHVELPQTMDRARSRVDTDSTPEH